MPTFSLSLGYVCLSVISLTVIPLLPKIIIWKAQGNLNYLGPSLLSLFRTWSETLKTCFLARLFNIYIYFSYKQETLLFNVLWLFISLSLVVGDESESLTLRKIVTGMLAAGMMNKQIFRNFQACESRISSLRTKIRLM